MKSEAEKENQKSLVTQNKDHQEINRGVLFFNLPHLLFMYSGLFKNDSELFLSFERVVTNNPDATSDGQFYRKLRKGEVNDRDFETFFNKLGLEIEKHIHDNASALRQHPLSKVGGWFLLYKGATGLLNTIECEPELQRFLRFIKYLCICDRDMISGGIYHRERPSHKRAWFIYSADSSSMSDSYEYRVGLILHWAVLFDYFRFYESEGTGLNTEKQTPAFIFNKILPVIKEGELVGSSSRFLEVLRDQWSQHKYSKQIIKWAQYYRDIADALQKQGFVDFCDEESVKKYFLRVRNDEAKLTSGLLKKCLLALYEANGTSAQYDPIFFSFAFVQVFDGVQRALQKEGLKNEDIVKLFARYPEYLSLVSQRYQEFCDVNDVKQ